MANTYTQLYYHIVFSTKDRVPWIKPDLEERIWKYLGGIARDNRAVALQVGGAEDHIHIVAGLLPNLAISKFVQLVKGGSSAWANDKLPRLKGFAWQDGYSAFTVSASNLAKVIAYVANQREHHRRKTFQEELRALLTKHGIEFDERYVWG